MKEIGEDSAVQSSKWQGLTDFFPKLSVNVDPQKLLDSINLIPSRSSCAWQLIDMPRWQARIKHLVG